MCDSDHPVALTAYFAAKEAETMDALYSGDPKEADGELLTARIYPQLKPAHLEQMKLWKHDGTGLVSHKYVP